jgi:myo-inositol-1(or 4)-monophosphatase
MSAVSANLAVMIKAIEKSSRNLMRDFNEVEKLQISVKGPGDFVSRADKRSEEIIVEVLTQGRPEWGFLGEEGSSQKGSDDRYRWIIDPLDGTDNFLHGLPHWCITIALEKEGEILAGITYDPVRDEMFRAEKNVGAFMNNTRLRVSGRKEIANTFISLNMGVPEYDAERAVQFGDLVTKVHTAKAKARVMASGALELAYVASGRFDISYILGGAKPWDVAAGILMIREAKGVITDLNLKPGTVESGGFLSGNADLHPKFASLVGLKS